MVFAKGLIQYDAFEPVEAVLRAKLILQAKKASRFRFFLVYAGCQSPHMFA